MAFSQTGNAKIKYIKIGNKSFTVNLPEVWEKCPGSETVCFRDTGVVFTDFYNGAPLRVSFSAIDSTFGALKEAKKYIIEHSPTLPDNFFYKKTGNESRKVPEQFKKEFYDPVEKKLESKMPLKYIFIKYRSYTKSERLYNTRYYIAVASPTAKKVMIFSIIFEHYDKMFSIEDIFTTDAFVGKVFSSIRLN